MKRVDFFDRHAATWDAHERPEMADRLRRVVACSRATAGQQVLDVGCGTGVLVPALLEALGPTGRVIELDSSQKMLDAARAKGFPGVVEYVCADIHHTGLADHSLDRVICNAAFPHFDDPRQAVREMVRVLRPGGALVISHPIGRQAVNSLHREAGGPVGKDRVPAPDDMRLLLAEAGLAHIEIIDEPEFFLALGWVAAVSG